MSKFEYHLDVFPPEDERKTEVRFTELGNAEWELVSIAYGERVVRAVFKREIEEVL